MNSFRLIVRFLAAQAVIAYGIVLLTLQMWDPQSAYNQGRDAGLAEIEEALSEGSVQGGVLVQLKQVKPMFPGVVILGCGLLLQFLVMTTAHPKAGRTLGYPERPAGVPRTIGYPPKGSTDS